MKRIFSSCVCIVFLFFFPFNPASAQSVQEVTRTIIHLDSLFWVTYNHCDLANMKQYFADDVEFYHDKGGITLGNENMVNSVKKGLCSDSNVRLRREAVPGTVRVFPLQKADTIYGAIISGDHYFYITQNKQKEFRSGQAKFSQLWIRKNGVWRMSRILSYDHRPASPDKEH